ncbi:COP9 signalosome complex subunit 3-like isoform X6 [Quercus suber]
MHRTTAFSQSPRAPTQCCYCSSNVNSKFHSCRSLQKILIGFSYSPWFSSSLPKYTSSAAWRNLKSFCQPYIELANGYSTGEIAELEANIQTNKENFERDNVTVKEANYYGGTDLM